MSGSRKNRTVNNKIRKSLKLKIAISILFFLISLIISGSFKLEDKMTYTNFVAVLLTVNFLPIMYWLGFWVWGEGFIFNTFKDIFLFFKNLFFWPYKVIRHDKIYKRFFARFVDLYLWCFCFFFITCQIIDLDKLSISLYRGIEYLVFILWFVVEPFFIRFTGTTFGKSLFGISICKIDGSSISFKEAFARTGILLAKGLAFGLPFISIYTLYKSKNKLLLEGTTDWDISCKTYLFYREVPKHQSVLGLAILFSFVMLSFLGRTYDQYNKSSFENENHVIESQITQDKSDDISRDSEKEKYQRDIYLHYQNEIKEKELGNISTKYKNERHHILIKYISDIFKLIERNTNQANINKYVYLERLGTLVYSSQSLLDRSISKYKKTVVDCKKDTRYDTDHVNVCTDINEISIANYFKIEGDILKKYKEMYFLLKESDFDYQEGKIIFYDNTKLELYNGITNELVQLAKKEREKLNKIVQK